MNKENKGVIFLKVNPLSLKGVSRFAFCFNLKADCIMTVHHDFHDECKTQKKTKKDIIFQFPFCLKQTFNEVNVTNLWNKYHHQIIVYLTISFFSLPSHYF